MVLRKAPKEIKSVIEVIRDDVEIIIRNPKR